MRVLHFGRIHILPVPAARRSIGIKYHKHAGGMQQPLGAAHADIIACCCRPQRHSFLWALSSLVWDVSTAHPLPLV